jgi:Ser/Thr protein kinase RdoA (MazF antagonist)
MNIDCLTTTMIETVLSAYGFYEDDTNVQSFGKGLINNTWKVISGDKVFILQRVNDVIFKRPHDITHNMKLIKDHLDQYHPEYNFVVPVTAHNGEELVFVREHGFYRLFPFVTDSHTKEVVETPTQAYEAALQFGKFTRLLSGLDVNKLKITIPGFHDLSLRFEQFTAILKAGSDDRVREAKELIRIVEDHQHIVRTYEKIKTYPSFRCRVVHHDTKISNVLFDKTDHGLCVIDLDTVMPGYFISDVGDMMRTYLSPVSEDEAAFDKIEIRDDFYKAILQGYLDQMKDELTDIEKTYFFYAGKFMTYMQALRFLGDHINNSRYYKEEYPGHNLVRATNQLTLLHCLVEKERELASII